MESRKNNLLNNAFPSKDKWFYLILFLFSFTFFAAIGYLSPPMADDLIFESQRLSGFKDIFHYAVYYGNGRLLGNFLGEYFCYHRITRTLYRGIVSASVIILMPNIAGCKSKISYLLSFIMIAGSGEYFFGNVLAWSSGFINYVTPFFLTLIVCLLFKVKFLYISQNNKLLNILSLILIFVFGISSQLFVEHSTIVNCIIAILVLIFCFNHRIERSGAVLYLMSTTIGGIVMILIPRLFYQSGNLVDGYRESSFGNIQKMIETVKVFLYNFIHWINSSFILITAVFSLIFVLLYIYRNHIGTKVSKALLSVNVLSFTCYLISEIQYSYPIYSTLKTFREYLYIVLVSVPVLTAIFLLFVILKAKEPDKKNNKYLLILLFLSAMSFAPLTVVTPCPSRTFFQGYVFLVMFILAITDTVSIKATETQSGILKTALSTGCVILSVCLTITYISFFQLNNLKENHIKKEISNHATEIELFEIDSMLIIPSLGGDYTPEYELLYYYSEPGDIKFIKLSTDEWLKKYT